MATQFEFVDIGLSNDQSRYESGDEVKGTVRLSLKGQFIVSNVKIQLVGEAEVKWVENPGTRYHRAGHLYRDKMRLVKLTYPLPKQCE